MQGTNISRMYRPVGTTGKLSAKDIAWMAPLAGVGGLAVRQLAQWAGLGYLQLRARKEAQKWAKEKKR